MPPMSRGRRVIMAAAIGATATALALAGCSGGSSSDSSTKPVLRVVAASSITSMNPVLNGTGIPQEFYLDPAYDSLIKREGDGTLAPGLATKWEYTDASNTHFRITLRKGVRFSDGEKMDAAAVKKWFQYFVDAPGSAFGPTFADIESIDIDDDYTLTLNLSGSDPLYPSNLTQNRYGYVISPKGIDNATALGTTTDGAGPYVLDPKSTTPGSTYTYLPNKYYWDKSKQKWSKLVVTVITDPNAVLSSIQSGQQDFAVGQARSAAAAQSAGIDVKSAPLLWDAVILMDRGGESLAPLGDVRVRQALNYAVDRKAIAKAVFGKYAQANVSMVVPGSDSFSEATEARYSYDPTKAKQLLAQAGYADGFTLPILVFNRNGTDETTFAQALQGYLSAINVKADLISAGNGSTLGADLLAKKYVAFAFFGQTEPSINLVSEQLVPTAGVLNPFKTDDPQLLSLYKAVQTAPQDKQKKALQALQDYIVEQAYYLQVSISDNVYFSARTVKGLDVSAAQPIPDIVDLEPAS